MANALNGINLAQIAEETLVLLEPQMFLLSAFYQDFSSDIKQRGESVTTRVPNSLTAVDVSNGYTGQDVNTVSKTVTLSFNKGHPMAFRDDEVSKAGDIEFLRRVFIKPAINSVLRAIVADVLALVTNTNYSANTNIAAANFTYNNVVDIHTALENANAMPGRNLLINPTYAGTLRKDSVLLAMVSGGNEPLARAGRLGPVAGFDDAYTYTNIPTQNNLVGIAAAPQALIIAARQLAVPNDPNVVDVVNVIDPTTGFPLQFRQFYVPLQKRQYITCEAFYGCNIGVAGNLNRIRFGAE
jgi:hypothetical protein